MSKAAEDLQRRFGRNLSESLGARSGAGAGPAGPGIGPAPAGPFPRETGPDDGRTRARDAGHMEVDRIVPDPDQPRKEFAEDAIERLAASLLEHGQLLPIRIRWNAPIGKWVVISGERRYRAAIRAGLKTVSCVFVDDGLGPSDVLQEQIIENLLREDLRPIEQARAYRQLMDLRGWTAKELSAELHVSQGSISKSLSLLTLPAELQGRVEDGAIPATAAYEVAKVEDREVQREIARRIVDEDLTRDDAAEAVREAAGRPARGPGPRAKGRGGASGRGMTRVFKVAGAKVTVTFARKSARVEEILQALDEASAQARGTGRPAEAL